jgi:PKD repeat protein
LKTGYITVNPTAVAPTAAFTSSKQSGSAPLAVTFTDQSTGTTPITYAWDFNNDGSTDSTAQNPSFTYNAAGTYSVKLTVTNSAGTNTALKTGYITVNPTAVAPIAAFTSSKQSGSAPLAVTFTDQSTGTTPITYAWDFNNDGSTDSTAQNPSFTYNAAGTYSVKLTVTNSAGTNTALKTGYITVTGTSPGSHSGIALTFDDAYVDDWYAIRDILNNNNVHATFFVAEFENLDQDKINKLKTLQADGNEIAFHGMYHTDAVEYLANHTIQQYLDYEIIPGINIMKNAGFNPVDFAYPYGHDDPSATLAMEGYFKHIRGTYYAWDDTVEYQYGSNQPFIYGIGIDDITYGFTINDIYNGISKAKTENKILILYGHDPVVSNPGMYQTSHDQLEKIIAKGKENNMTFYRISDIN